MKMNDLLIYTVYSIIYCSITITQCRIMRFDINQSHHIHLHTAAPRFGTNQQCQLWTDSHCAPLYSYRAIFCQPPSNKRAQQILQCPVLKYCIIQDAVLYGSEPSPARHQPFRPNCTLGLRPMLATPPHTHTQRAATTPHPHARCVHPPPFHRGRSAQAPTPDLQYSPRDARTRV